MSYTVLLVVLAVSAHGVHAGRRQVKLVEEDAMGADDGNDDGTPPRSWSASKRKEVESATAAEARERERRMQSGEALLPLFPTHTTICGGRVCRPGEGNLKHSMEKTANGAMRFKQWTQPYEHREAYVQAKSRRIPHRPDAAHYGTLVNLARPIADKAGGLLLVTVADFDYRELALNWVAHARKLGHANTLVLSMDTELHALLTARGVASFDDSANLAAWNHTCLQRHIQAVRMERHVAVAALIAAGIDVLYTDATAVLLSREVVASLRAQPAELDVLLQRDDWPAEPMRRMGTAVNAGFVYLRSANGEDVVSDAPRAERRVVMDARSMVMNARRCGERHVVMGARRCGDERAHTPACEVRSYHPTAAACGFGRCGC